MCFLKDTGGIKKAILNLHTLNYIVLYDEIVDILYPIMSRIQAQALIVGISSHLNHMIRLQVHWSSRINPFSVLELTVSLADTS